MSYAATVKDFRKINKRDVYKIGGFTNYLDGGRPLTYDDPYYEACFALTVDTETCLANPKADIAVMVKQIYPSTGDTLRAWVVIDGIVRPFITTMKFCGISDKWGHRRIQEMYPWYKHGEEVIFLGYKTCIPKTFQVETTPFSRGRKFTG